jgi:hypothetical protein
MMKSSSVFILVAASPVLFLGGDTERLEKLFELYTKMTSQLAVAKKTNQRKTKGAKS